MTTALNYSQAQAGHTTYLPTSAHFLLNDKCNAKCVFCGGNYYNSRSGRMMTLEKFRIIADNIHLEHYRQAILAGAGDPLLCPDFVPIMQHLHAAYPSVEISVTTNGIALNRELSEAMLACGVTMLNISLNAATKETYRRLMQVDAFDSICQQIQDFSKLCREHGRGPQLQLSIPIMRCNAEELPLLIQFAHEVGAGAVNVFYCRFYPREIRNDKDGGFLPDKESLFFYQELSDRIVTESEQLAQRLGVQLMHEPLFSQGYVPKNCSWADNELMIGFDGEVFPCGGGELHFKKRIERGEYNFGNALQQPIEEFWNNDSYRAIRVSSKRSGQCVIPECRECSNMTSHMEQRGHILEWADFSNGSEPVATDATSPFPLVSVIVPTHNRPDMLKETIQSILDQTFQDFEIIVVNDAGQDVSTVVQTFNSPKISYLSHETNKGLAGARNTGTRAARGKYIAYLDDDDIFYPEHLATLVTFLQESGESVAYTDAYRAHQVRREDGTYAVTERDVPYSFDFNFKDILIGNYIPVTCFMHDIKCIHEAGYFDESLHSHEDWDLWIRMSQKYAFHHIKKLTCEFRWREDGTSMTSSKEPEFISTQERIYEKYQHISSRLPDVAQAQRRELYNRKKNAGVTVPLDCSIIIPVFNQVAYTKQCLEMLYANTPEDLSFEVIIVDNASSDDTAEFLNAATQRYRNLRVIRNNENLLFAKACNQGAQAAGGEYLVFLNNDTEPLPGWLDHGLARLKSDQSIGVVGSKLLYPDGTIQHCGIEFTACPGLEAPWPRHRYLNAAGDDPRVNISEKVPMVTGACLFISKELFREIGGFCPDYGMYFEDIDLCMKIRKRGMIIWYEPLSVLVHHESKSSQLSRQNLDSLCLSASVIFYKRWLSEVIAGANQNHLMNPLRNVRTVREPAIVIDGVIFQLQHGRPFGISRLWWSLLTELAATPLAGRIILLDREGTAPEIPGIRRRSVTPFQLGTAREEAPGLDRVCCEENAGLFISTYYTFTTSTPSLLMLYDMIPERFDSVGPDAPNPEWRDKYHAIVNSTSFAAISQSTASDLAAFYPQAAQRPLTVIPCAVSDDFRMHSAEEIAAFKSANGIDRPYFLLVGRRDPHKNAVLFFRGFARLPERERYAIIMAGGGNALEPELRELAGPAAGYAGFFSDQDLSLAYSGAIALVYPSLYEGFGLPILEAMQSGCPVITCQNSSLSEVAGSAALYVGEQDAEGMSRALLDVQNPDVRAYLIKRGLERTRLFSWQKSAALLADCIRENSGAAATMQIRGEK